MELKILTIPTRAPKQPIQPFHSFFRRINHVEKTVTDQVDQITEFHRGYFIDRDVEYVLFADFNINGLLDGLMTNDVKVFTYDDGSYAVRMDFSWKFICRKFRYLAVGCYGVRIIPIIKRSFLQICDQLPQWKNASQEIPGTVTENSTWVPECIAR